MKEWLLKALLPIAINMILKETIFKPENLRNTIADGIHWLRGYIASTDNEIDDAVGEPFLDLICETFNIPIVVE